MFTPFAELFHFESKSRGSDIKKGYASRKEKKADAAGAVAQSEREERYNKESAQFKAKWKEELEAGDPYYNPNFTLDRSDYSLRL